MNGSPRNGAILILVAGLAAILLGLSLAFLMRMRSEAAIARTLIEEAQARILLAAACNYVLETSRIGWGEEAYGWIDIRVATFADGHPGPRGHDGRRLPKRPDGSWAINPTAAPLLRWPALGGTARCPLFLPEQPPYATQGRYAYNPVPRWGDGNNARQLQYHVPVPLPVGFPDPEPTTEWDYADLPLTADGLTPWENFTQGSRIDADNPASLRGASGRAPSWFRVHRSGPDRFILTMGSGGSLGYRSWSEVVLLGDTSLFFGEQQIFEELRNRERRLFYECQWSPSVGSRVHGLYAAQHNMNHSGGQSGINSTVAPPNLGYELMPENSIHQMWSVYQHYAQPARSDSINQHGTIAWIRRLFQEPPEW